jgi:hypothetical protein
VTLRDAIAAANSNVPVSPGGPVGSGADTIEFAAALSGDTISLTNGQLAIIETLTIDASSLAANVTIDAQQQSRVLSFSATSGDLTLNGLNVVNGYTNATSQGGGGIRFDSSGALELINTTVSGNRTAGLSSTGGGISLNDGAAILTHSTVLGNSTLGAGFSSGGGIFSRNGAVTLTASTVSGNSSRSEGGGIYGNESVTVIASVISGNSSSFGGGIYSNDTLTVIASVISGNSARGDGGGIYHEFGSVMITDSTISGNTAGNEGGGIYTWGASTTISNSTISGNDASVGGGIWNGRGLVRIEYSTITGNSAVGQGDGVWSAGNSSTRTDVLSSIIAGNNGDDDVHTNGEPNEFVSLGYNLIGGGNDLGAFNQTGDQTGVTNPLLAPLAFNGGPTPTHALLPGSPAMDSGNPSFAAPPGFDQRGAPFARVFGGRIDIGAFEAQPIIFVVDTNVDESDGDYSPGDLSLREAVELANINPFDDSISFDPLLAGDTIGLTMGELAITDTLTIDASALAQNVTIDAQQNSRVLNFSATSGDLTLNGLNVVNGYTTAANEGGGGIHFGSGGALTVTGSTVSGNSTSGDSARGGAIYTISGSLTFNRSTVSGNRTIGNSAHAGAIFSNLGAVILNRSAVSGNSTAGNFATGGGILTGLGPVTLNNSTVSGNSTAGANGSGGGIRTFGGTVTLNRSTLSGNSTTGIEAEGGGIWTEYGNVSLINSTVSGNSTTGMNADGGGIWVYSGAVTLAGSTVSKNSSGGSGGGIFLYDGFISPSLTIENSIVAGNTAVGAGPEFIAGPDSTLTVTNSLIGDNAGTTLTEAQTADSNGNLIGSAAGAGVIDALLGPLQSNGGPTETHALLPGSPAIDAGFAVAENVALGGTATQSSEFEFASFPGSNAIDGDLTNFTHTDDSDNMASWQVDLDGVYSISEIVLHNRDLADTALRFRDLTVKVLNANGVAVFTSELLNPENVLNDPETLTIDLVGLTGGPAVGSTVRVSRTADPDNSGGGSGQADQNVLSLGEVLVSAAPAYDQRGVPFTRFSGPQDMGAYEAQTLSLVVDTNVDESDGDYSPGDLSLREAIELANANSGADAIHFDGALAGQPINLSLGQLTISDDVTINGLGASLLTIDAQGVSRVMEIGSSVTADISGLTLTGGLADRGAGLRVGSSSTVTLTDVVVRGNESTSTGFDSGGGVWNANASTLTIIDSVIADNTSAGNGGGVWNRGTLSIARSTVSGNAATGSFSSGGGVVNSYGDLTITDSTLSGNSATYSGGAIYSVASADLTTTATRITGSTISGNTAVRGGGLFNYLGLTQIRHSTITANEASGEGDGVWSFGYQFSSTRTEVTSSIISGNIGDQDVFTNNLINGFFSGGYNLTGYGNIATDAFVSTGDVSGITDPMLAALADNGGPTLTHALLSGSAALDAGNPVFAAPPAFDQRGAPFARVFGGRIDIGALEAQTLTLVVDTDMDESDGDYSAGDLSLREAIELANFNPGADVVTFDAALTGGTISLAGSELEISDTLSIDASSLTANVTIDAQQQSRVLHFSATSGDLMLNGLNVINGYTTAVSQGGGGIRFDASGVLTLTKSTISGSGTTGNSAHGGAIYAYAGAVTLSGSTVDGNSTTGFGASGGGIYTYSGAVTLTNSSVSGNSTTGTGALGGGIAALRGPVNLLNSTVSGNSTAGDLADGGGITSSSGNVTLTGSTVSGNNTSGSAANGGGAWAFSGDVIVTNSTFSGNSTAASNASGGGLWAFLGDVTFTNSTISGNSSGASGGGLFVNDNDSNPSLTIHNSIVAGNAATVAGPDLLHDPQSTLTVMHSLIGDNTGSTLTEAQTADSNGNLIGSATGAGVIDALLSPLQNNGGPVLTHALLSGSPAIDAGDPAFTIPPEFDQRGAPYTRVFGGRIDIGAYEVQPLVLVVDTDVDESDGDYSPGDLSLREAIERANANPVADTITFAPVISGSTISLVGGELEITETLTIDASSLSANVTIDAQQQSRVMDFSASSGDLTLGGINLVNGLTTGDFSNLNPGAGIYFGSSGTLTLTSSTVSDNQTTGVSAHGGGIYSSSGAVILTNSTVRGNSTTGRSQGGGVWTRTGDVSLTNSTVKDNSATEDGGGIRTQFGAVTIIDSTVSGNRTTASSARGGGIVTTYGDVTLTRSTVSGNSTVGSGANGGGIWAGSGDVTVANSTVSGNSTAASDASGGGIWTVFGAVTVTNSTVSGNSSGASGGGIFVNDNNINPSLTIQNSIVAGNTAVDAGPNFLADPEGTLTVTNSLISDNAGTSLAEAQTADSHGNLIGSAAGAGVIHALLGPLQNNGGPTQTQALLPGSPAIDAGDDALAVALTYDQRGAPFTRFFSTVDMGAYEAQTLSLVVDTHIDESDGDYSSGDLSLREAIELANANPGADLVTFDAALSGGTISLVGGELTISDALTIDASSLAQNVTIDAQQQSRVLNVITSSGDVFLNALNVVNGYVTGLLDNGAGIRFDSSGTLTLSNSTVSGNRATGFAARGGGIYAAPGALTVTDSTIAGNTAGGNGGGIGQRIGTLLVTGSTISGNSAGRDGGGIFTKPFDGAISNSTMISNSTISGNSAGIWGGGIYSFTRGNLTSGNTTISNSTISGNSSDDEGGGVFNSNGLTRIEHSTITDNSAVNSGDGVWSWGDFSTRTDVLSSIIAGNNGNDDVHTNGDPNEFVSLGHNLIGGGNGLGAFSTPGDQPGVTNPMLAVLADNGGPTLTHALLFGSPAIDAGDPTAVPGQSGVPSFDQRGVPFVRVVGNSIDLGAFEFIPPAPQVVDVIISGSSWDPGFIDAVDGKGPGAGNGLGYSLVGAHQLDTVPWFGADVLYVRFNSDVSASLGDGDAVLTGTNGGTYSLGILEYGTAGPNILTIPINGGIDVDSLVLTIFDGALEESDGDALDGEWTTGQTKPSGDGAAGGRFEFFFNVLPGDADGSGQVTSSDAFFIFESSSLATTADLARKDVDGSGQITSSDAFAAFANSSLGLPGPPTPPSGSTLFAAAALETDSPSAGDAASDSTQSVDAVFEQLGREDGSAHTDPTGSLRRRFQPATRLRFTPTVRPQFHRN